MSMSGYPENEKARMEAIRRYEVLDTPPEEAYDEFISLTAQIFGAPISLITLVDADRTWFKANMGLQVPEVPRDISFCAHAILQQDVFVVPDTLQDERFRMNPFVTAENGIRFYAGAPLVTAEGYALGTLCVLDRRPREFLPEQLSLLRTLARQVVTRLELRRTVKELERNIAEHNETQTALASTRSIFRSIFEATTDAIYVKNYASRYLMINTACARLLRRPADEVIGKTDEDLFEPDAARRFMDADFRVMLNGEAQTFEDVFTTSGITRTYHSTKAPYRDAHGSVIGVIGISSEISDRKEMEKALRESEKRYRTLFEHVPVGVYRTTPDGRIINANPSLVSMLGYSTLEDLTRENLEGEGFGPQYSRHEFRERLNRESEIRGLEAAWKTRDNRLIDVRENARVMRDANGNPLYYEGTLEDVTERKKVERMKDELISVVAHELRVPLSSIRGSLEYMSRKMAAELPEKAKQLTDMAYRGTERLVRLINDLLDIDKIESGKMVFESRPTQVIPLVEQALEANLAYAEQLGVKLSLSPSVTGALVYTDPDRFIQVMTNLLSNAAKFSPPQSAVTVSVIRKDGSIRTSVTDQGPGIPENFRNQVFQKFAQAGGKEAKGGSGLGLSITKAIVEKLGGTVGFETQTNAGTTFYFDLPEHRLT